MQEQTCKASRQKKEYRTPEILIKMGINYCLSTLASSLHRLRRLGKLARKYENAELREAAGEIADIASDIVLPMIKKLFSLSLGQPIGFPSNSKSQHLLSFLSKPWNVSFWY